jgi:hypothetical protein
MKVLKQIGTVAFLAFLFGLAAYALSRNFERKFVVEFTPFWIAVSLFVVLTTVGVIVGLIYNVCSESKRANEAVEQINEFHRKLLTAFNRYEVKNSCRNQWNSPNWQENDIPNAWAQTVDRELETLCSLRNYLSAIIELMQNLSILFWDAGDELTLKAAQLKNRHRTIGLFVIRLRGILEKNPTLREILDGFGGRQDLLWDLLNTGVKRGFVTEHDPLYMEMTINRASEHARRMDDRPPTDKAAPRSAPPTTE